MGNSLHYLQIKLVILFADSGAFSFGESFVVYIFVCKKGYSRFFYRNLENSCLSPVTMHSQPYGLGWPSIRLRGLSCPVSGGVATACATAATGGVALRLWTKLKSQMWWTHSIGWNEIHKTFFFKMVVYRKSLFQTLSLGPLPTSG